jgi:carboxyl-terminal processing protease
MTKKIKLGVAGVSLAAILFIVAGGLGVQAAGNEGAYRQLGVYSEVLQRIRSEYVEEPNFEAVRQGALHGLLESLDSNSSYLSPLEYKRIREQRPDTKANIGAAISKRYGFAAVVSLVPNGPGEKAGLEQGDLVESIEGKSTREMSLVEIRNVFAGAKGSNVMVTVLRPSRAEPEKLTITRDEVSWPSTQERVLESNVGYIKPSALTKGKAQELASKVKQVERNGAKKLILDLRDVADGEFSEAVAAANLFLESGNITSLKGQTYAREDFNAEPSKAVTKLPLVVLVNRGTAGPAEVLAAAILDNKRGDLIGDRTFGTGSLTKLIEVPDGSALVLSVAKYYTPGGKAIQDNSITPNIAVADADEQDLVDLGDDTTTSPEQEKKPRTDATDLPLQRAIAVLKNKAS